MKKNLNDQVTLVVANVTAIKVWNRELPSFYEEGKTVFRKEVQLFLDEALEANTASGEMTSIGVLWDDLKKVVRKLPCGSAYFSLLPKWESDLLDQDKKVEEKQKPDERFAAHVAPMLVGARVVLLQSRTLAEATDENGATAELASYIRGLATPQLAKKLEVEEELKKELTELKMQVVELTPIFKVRGAIKQLLSMREEKQLQDKERAQKLGVEFQPVDYYEEKLQLLYKKEEELTADKMLEGIL